MPKLRSRANRYVISRATKRKGHFGSGSAGFGQGVIKRLHPRVIPVPVASSHNANIDVVVRSEAGYRRIRCELPS